MTDEVREVISCTFLRLLQGNKRANSLMRFFIGKAWDAGNGRSFVKSHNAVLWKTSPSPQRRLREGNLPINRMFELERLVLRIIFYEFYPLCDFYWRVYFLGVALRSSKGYQFKLVAQKDKQDG